MRIRYIVVFRRPRRILHVHVRLSVSLAYLVRRVTRE